MDSGGPGTWVTRTYSATRGGGAFLNGQRISVSKTEQLQRSLLVRAPASCPPTCLTTALPVTKMLLDSFCDAVCCLDVCNQTRPRNVPAHQNHDLAATNCYSGGA